MRLMLSQIERMNEYCLCDTANKWWKGAGGSGYGNFGELGPLDEYLNDREYSWLKKVHLLFIDNPVGAGYSYVDNLNLLTTDIDQIGDDDHECTSH